MDHNADSDSQKIVISSRTIQTTGNNSSEIQGRRRLIKDMCH